MALVEAIAKDLEQLNQGGEQAGGGLANKGANQSLRSGAQATAPKQAPPPDDLENAVLIHQILKLGENKETIWTEMIRLLILHGDERLEIDQDILQDENTSISELLKKVGSLSPRDYTWSLSYKEKLDLLLYLVDTVHDMDTFRQFLNKRLEEKSKLFKLKNDMHGEIKKIEQDKAEAMARFNSENQDSNNQIVIEIDELKEKLLCASRTESKWINNRIQELSRQKNKFNDEMLRFDD